MSIFNPETFLATQTQGALDTKVITVPPDEYDAQIISVKARQIENKKEGGFYTLMDLTWEVLDEKAKAATKRDRPTVRQEFFLDISLAGGLDMSPQKNVALGRLRAALGQNDPSLSWSPLMMQGGMAKIKVGQRPNPNDPENPFAEVTAVTKL